LNLLYKINKTTTVVTLLIDVYFKYFIMRILPISRIVIFIVILSSMVTLCEAQSFKRPAAPRQGKNVMKRSPAKKRQVKIKEPRVAVKARKKKEADERKRTRDYKKYVKANRQRSLEIQTPEVRARMKQNMKNARDNYKLKKKNIIANSRKSGRKYRR